MTSLQRLAAALAETVSRTGDFAPFILFFATFVEYVFPPFPGDLLVVLGAWYSVQGTLSWPVTFVSVTAGAVAGAWVDYRIGAGAGAAARRRARRAEAPAHRGAAGPLRGELPALGGVAPGREPLLPGLRAFLFLAAGASGIPLRRVLLYGGLSAALWNVLLLGAGALVAHNVEELLELFERYTRAAWMALVAVALLAWCSRSAGRAWRRRAARKRGAAAAEDR